MGATISLNFDTDNPYKLFRVHEGDDKEIIQFLELLLNKNFYIHDNIQVSDKEVLLVLKYEDPES